MGDTSRLVLVRSASRNAGNLARWPMGSGCGERSAAWGVVAVVFGGSAVPTWIAAAAPGVGLIAWVGACVFSLVAAIGLYMCFATLNDWWPW